jgi:hypothetical protein
MEVVFAIPLLFIPLAMPMIAGLMAKSFGRKFWPWFLVGIPLPFIANIILLCLPDKSKKETTCLTVVKNEERSDKTTINKYVKQEANGQNQLPATA